MKTIVVPCFNEAARLSLEAFEAFDAAGVRVLFVDDGSTDHTRALIEGFVSRRPNTGLLPLDHNQGKGEAVRRGLLEALARGSHVVGYLDADLATAPSEMLEVIDAVQGAVEVVLGSRVQLLGRKIDRRPVRHYLGRVFATSASLALGLPVYDTQCGAKAFLQTPRLKAALQTPFTARWAFDVELLQRLSAPVGGVGLPEGAMVELPLRAWRDVAGSKLGVKAMAAAALDLLQIGARRWRERG